jgi:hypothetical protein
MKRNLNAPHLGSGKNSITPALNPNSIAKNLTPDLSRWFSPDTLTIATKLTTRG